MQAVIMAGGFGTRIQPLTSTLPKPMLPFFNRPMMAYIVESLKNAGIVDLIVLLYFKPDIIKNYFGDGRNFGVNIRYILPDDDYGTAGAVKKAEKFLNETFIIVSGDLVTNFNLQEILGFHEAKQSKATITLTSVEDPLQFGVIITDRNDKIVRFLEKPGWGEVFSDTINTGIYVLEPDILKLIPPDKPFDFAKDLFPLMFNNGINIYGYKAKGYWKDVGNPDAYREVHMDVMNKNLILNSIGGQEIKYEEGILYKGNNTRIDKDVKIKGFVVIGNNVKLKKNAIITNTVIGDDTVIGEGCEIKNSIIWNNVTTGKYVFLNYVVICDKTRTGNYVKAPSGCIIAENTEVGDHVVFERDVMVWPNKQIEESSIISSNLIWGDKWKKSIFEGGKVSARTNVELSAEIATKLGSSVGSIIPKGSRVLLSRDYHRAARMLKRSFLGGLLSTGVNAVDVRMASLPVMRYNLNIHSEIFAVHFRQSPVDPTHTEIMFFDGNSLPIDTNLEKSVERIFYKENFRRATHDEIGNIYDVHNVQNEYLTHFLETIDVDIIKARHYKIAVNLLNGTTDEVFPDILNRVNIDSIVLNAYHDESKLARTYSKLAEAEKQTSDIVKIMGANIGFVIYPHGEKLKIITDKGDLLSDDIALMLFIKLLDKLGDRKYKVYIPVMAPYVLDDKLSNVQIIRGKLIGLKATFIRGFDFMGDLSAEYRFTEHAIAPDGMYASIKLVELLTKVGKSISELLIEIPYYYFKHNVINCPVEKKGYLMRKMSEDALDKDASYIDGIKINYAKKGWILMIPDQYSPNVHLFTESSTNEAGEELQNEYKEKINKWLEENN